MLRSHNLSLLIKRISRQELESWSTNSTEPGQTAKILLSKVNHFQFQHDKGWKEKYTYPQCFIFCGLSILTAILIDKSSGQFLVVFILCHSASLLLLPVGRKTTWKKKDTFSIHDVICIINKKCWTTHMPYLTLTFDLVTPKSIGVIY